MNNPQRHGFIWGPRESLLDAGFEHLAAIDDRPDLGYGAEGGVLLECVPVAVEGDQSGLVLRHVFAENALHA